MAKPTHYFWNPETSFKNPNRLPLVLLIAMTENVCGVELVVFGFTDEKESLPLRRNGKRVRERESDEGSVEKVPVQVSPQSAFLPIGGLHSTLAIFPENSYGSIPYKHAEVNGKIVLVLRGKCTIDNKVINATNAGAAGVLIVNTSVDALGPDLDELSSIFVGCIDKEGGSALIDRFADYDVCLNPCKNALGYVISSDVDNVRRILSSSGFFDIADNVGHTPFHYVVARKSPELTIILAEIIAILRTPFPTKMEILEAADCGSHSRTAFYTAIHNGNADAVKLLCQLERSLVNQMRRSDGWWPVHMAAKARRLDCLRALYDAEANLDATTTDGTSVLQISAKGGCHHCCRFLIRSGCAMEVGYLQHAEGAARTYLEDVYSHELLEFVKCNGSHENNIKTVAKDRLIADMGQYIDHSSVEVITNAQCSNMGELFVSRNKIMRETFSPDDEVRIDRTTTGSIPIVNKMPPLKCLWHGCDPGILDSVMHEGFKVSYANLSFNVFGAGIYFATDAKLSAYFVSNDVQMQLMREPDPVDGTYSLIFAVVMLGAVGVREALCGGTESEKQRMKGDLKHPANRNPPVGCDSATGTNLKELVVYENTQAFPLARVKFRLRCDATIPDPYSQDAVNRNYLRSLLQLPTGLGEFMHKKEKCTRGAEVSSRVFLDMAPVSIRYKPKLIMNWTPGDGQGPATDELLDKIAELENKVHILEQENLNLRKERVVFMSSGSSL